MNRMIEFKTGKKVTTLLNIAPLIDVVFLLLIFFMLSSHFVTQPGIKLTLPAATTGSLHHVEDIIIVISSDNNLYLNEEEVGLGDLLDKLKAQVRESNKKIVIIKADEKVDLGLAVEIMDIAKQAGADGLVISTRPVETGLTE